jgi:transposase
VASNVVGKTGWLILNAIAGGCSDGAELAQLAQGSLKGKTEELAAAVKGYITPHFRWLLKQGLQNLARLDEQLEETESRIRHRMEPHADTIRRLCTIPGVDQVTAWTLVAEVGTDMTKFADADHLASWAGLCPGNCESAGKRQTGRTRQGNRYLRRMLIQNAWAVTHKKDCYLTAVFYRICAHRGMKRAAMAVAHRILTIAYILLRDGGVYQERGGNYFDRQNPARTARRLLQRLAAIGYETEVRGPVEGLPASGEANPIGPTAATTKSKRGRPRRTTPRPFGTLRWTGDLEQANTPSAPANRKVTSPKTSQIGPPATPELCPRCAAWRIPCIHEWKKNRAASHTPESTESET